MKKFYFLTAAAVLLTVSMPVPVSAQGTSCETAIPMPQMLMGMNITGETWYTLTVDDLSLFPSSAVSTDQAEIVVFDGCGGSEAIRNVNEPNSWFLYPGTEYKVRIIPRENIAGMFIMGSLSMAQAPNGIYCVKPIILPSPEDEDYGAAVKQPLGTTKWYQKEFIFNGNVNVTRDGMNVVSDLLTKIELKNGDCNAVSNVSEQQNLGGYVMAPAPFAKAGTNLIAVTFAPATDTEETEGQFHLAISSPNTDCVNRPEYISKTLVSGTESQVTNGYRVADFTFTPTESGIYTFTCHAAEGTVFNVGTVEKTGEQRNPGTEYASDIYECRYENAPVIIGSSNDASMALDLTAGTKYVLHYDADYTLEDGTPFVKVEKGGVLGIGSVSDKKTDVQVSENPTDGDFTVSSYLLKYGAEIALYDMAAKRVFSVKAQGGSSEQDVLLTGVKPGMYLLVVYGANRSACTKLIVK